MQALYSQIVKLPCNENKHIFSDRETSCNPNRFSSSKKRDGSKVYKVCFFLLIFYELLGDVNSSNKLFARVEMEQKANMLLDVSYH